VLNFSFDALPLIVAEFAISIFRGLSASGTSRKRSICSKPSRVSAPIGRFNVSLRKGYAHA